LTEFSEVAIKTLSSIKIFKDNLAIDPNSRGKTGELKTGKRPVIKFKIGEIKISSPKIWHLTDNDLTDGNHHLVLSIRSRAPAGQRTLNEFTGT
jgi:hypothetical protein